MPTKIMPDKREIRVFISSTFRDMQKERDELVKHVFPQIRKLCERRGVGWGEVDLRWGITEEQQAEGKVLPICLEEIRRCRPYFIGLLGERYGWILDEIPAELVEREPWLAELPGHSVTELEILHGVLNDPGMAEQAYFYFRDPAYLERLPTDEQETFRERPVQKEIDEFGLEEANRLAEQRREKLTNLKERIRLSGLTLRENYPDPYTFGEWVLEDLTAVIDRLYPEGPHPSPLDQEAAEHESFAISHAKAYISRQADFERLNAHARGNGLPMVMTGESGVGKSALLANWAIQYRNEHPDEVLLMHFIGATPVSADRATMLRRILGELKRHFAIQADIPDQPEALQEVFGNWLNMAAAQRRVVLILDALNQLEDLNGEPNLAWLPPTIPEKVRLIVSTLPGRLLEELEKRGWPVMRVEPLTIDERRHYIKTYLAQYSKALSQTRIEIIAKAPATSNPLYLRVLLDELRLSGVHEEIDERIRDYLEADKPDDLYEKVLTRYEQDYQRGRPGLVGEAMSAIWAARRGLSEPELLEMLGTEGKALPGATWSPLSLALEGAMLNRGGLFVFAHDYLRQAVRDRYLPNRESQRAVHLRLAGYFAGHESEPRQIQELPWHYRQAGEWKLLYDLLTRLPFFSSYWYENKNDLEASWAQLERNSDFSVLAGYRKVLDDPKTYGGYAWPTSILLNDFGHPVEASSLWGYLIGRFRQAGDKSSLQAALGNQSMILFKRGDLDGAMRLLAEQESLCRSTGDNEGLQVSLGSQAVIHRNRGEHEKALMLLKEQENICREIKNNDGLRASLGNQANILHRSGNPAGAMALHKEEERLCRASVNKAGMITSLGNQAVILSELGDLEGAMTIHQEEELLCREMGNKEGLAVSIGNQANIRRVRGDLKGALQLFQQQERQCRELGYLNLLQWCLGHMAWTLSMQGDLEKAMSLHKEQEQLCRTLGNKEGLQNSHEGQAGVLYKQNDLAGAIAFYKEEERLCREMGDRNKLITSLNNQIRILSTRGDLMGALALLKQTENLSREQGNKDRLQDSLFTQANILQAQHVYEQAMRLYKEAERLCREMGNKSGICRILGNQALILKVRGDVKGAMAMHKEEEHLCRELGKKDGLAICLVNQASILGWQMNMPGQALPLADEAYRLAIECHNAGLASQIENIRMQIRLRL